MTASSRSPLIIGAGPAGLTAALHLVKKGVKPRIYEASGGVGGLARTPKSGEWRLDPGGHRFFTRSKEVLDLWESLLPPDQWVSVQRRSAMLVHDQYVQYPLVGRDLLTQLGFKRGIKGISSFLWARSRGARRHVDDSASFREWGANEFGSYWYKMFFDGYVRKTWLAHPDDLASDWANQRIKPINWRLRGSVDQEFFSYPVRGPGQLWEAAAADLAAAQVFPSLDSPVVRARLDGATWTIELQGGETVSGDAVFSSMPLRLLVGALEPEPPEHIKAAAAALKHRGLITVAVALRTHYVIPFNWVYTPSASFRVGRIQNYGLWSKGLLPEDWDGTYLGFEYFVGPDGELWSADENRLKEIVAEDLRGLGIDSSGAEHVMVVRSKYAYPICDPARDKSVAEIREYLERNYPSLYPIGRNGMHRYDNQDHAMLSAMQSVAQYFGDKVDPWSVNTDRGYHETGVLER